MAPVCGCRCIAAGAVAACGVCVVSEIRAGCPSVGGRFGIAGCVGCALSVPPIHRASKRSVLFFMIFRYIGSFVPSVPLPYRAVSAVAAPCIRSSKQRLSDCRVRSARRFGCWKVSVRSRCSPDRTQEVVSLQRFGRCAMRFVQPDDIRLYDFAAVDPSCNDRRQKVPTTRAAVLLGRSEGEAGTFSQGRSGLCRRLRFCMPRLLLARSLRHVEMRRRLHRRSISGAHSSISRCTHSIPTLRSRSRPSSERYSSQ